MLSKNVCKQSRKTVIHKSVSREWATSKHVKSNPECFTLARPLLTSIRRSEIIHTRVGDGWFVRKQTVLRQVRHFLLSCLCMQSSAEIALWASWVQGLYLFSIGLSLTEFDQFYFSSG